MASRLVALNKNPGVRPIGVGETLHRIISKAICLVTRCDVETLCGTDQLSAGTKLGVEGAIHAMDDLFVHKHEDDWGLLLVDASNAFNRLNRMALLWNVRILRPRASCFLFNPYRGWAPLVLKDFPEFIYSSKGVTQGDTISLFVYAVETLPLIQSLKRVKGCTQIWYADDSSVCGKISELKEWFTQLLNLGPFYGYFPEPVKSHVVVDSTKTHFAKEAFSDIGVQVVTSQQVLGGVIGPDCEKELFVKQKLNEWIQHLETLSDVADEQPQAAYCAFTMSFQAEWIFLQRVLNCNDQLFAELEHTVFSHFLYTLPVR